MTRLAAFLSGIALGAVLMALLVVGLWRAPRVQIGIDWPQAPKPIATPVDAASPAPPSVSPSVPLFEASAEPPALAAPAPAETAAVPADPPIAPPSANPPAAAEPAPAAELSLLIPVQGVQAIALYDTFSQARGSERAHEAIDIMAPRGTPVIAAGNGRVAKLFTSAQGGLTVYQFDASGRYALYYAHLDAYAPELVEGAELKRGDPIGTVGSSGNASPDGPHLHFAVFLLGPERRWWQGTAINPYPLLER